MARLNPAHPDYQLRKLLAEITGKPPVLLDATTRQAQAAPTTLTVDAAASGVDLVAEIRSDPTFGLILMSVVFTGPQVPTGSALRIYYGQITPAAVLQSITDHTAARAFDFTPALTISPGDRVLFVWENCATEPGRIICTVRNP